MSCILLFIYDLLNWEKLIVIPFFSSHPCDFLWLHKRTIAFFIFLWCATVHIPKVWFASSYSCSYPPPNKYTQFLLFCFVSFPLLLTVILLHCLFFQQICARDQIEYLTAQAWLSKDEKLEQKVCY